MQRYNVGDRIPFVGGLTVKVVEAVHGINGVELLTVEVETPEDSAPATDEPQPCQPGFCQC